MGRPPSTEVQLRNHELIKDIKGGMSQADAAAKYGMSRSMVSQLLRASTETEEEIPEDTRARLIHLANRSIEIAFQVAEGPGRAITSGAGNHVVDSVSGLPAYDPSPKLDALRQIDAASTKLAKLTAAEKPPAKPVEEHPEMQQTLEWLKETAKANELLRQENERLQGRIAALENAHPIETVD